MNPLSRTAEDLLARIKERQTTPSTEQLAMLRKEKKLYSFSRMIDLAETDPGMEDLLNKAEEYYLLKKG